MPRYKLTVEYDGTPYYGWQKQAEHPSVQAAIERACSQFMGVDTLVEIFCAGRTDAGVHALGQVAHVDFHEPRPVFNIIQGLNNYLRPHPISIVAAEEVADDFHARFDAKMRHYLYRINNRKMRLTLDVMRVWHVPKSLDIEAMIAASGYLLGHHDFTSFRSSQCQAKSAMRTLDVLNIQPVGDEIHVTCSARSFLHHQVRNMVGMLAEVGLGKCPPDAVKTALEARDRTAAGLTAPAHGLYFTKVEY